MVFLTDVKNAIYDMFVYDATEYVVLNNSQNSGKETKNKLMLGQVMYINGKHYIAPVDEISKEEVLSYYQTLQSVFKKDGVK